MTNRTRTLYATMHYSVCAWYGALLFANLTHDDRLGQDLMMARCQ